MTKAKQPNATQLRQRRKRGIGVGGFLYDNGLTIAFGGLFLASVFGQSWTGMQSHNHRQEIVGTAQLGYLDYMLSGEFLDAVLVNWQAAMLQFLSITVLSVFLVQRGAKQSRDPDAVHQHLKSRSLGHWIRHHSMSAGFLVLFIATFVLHLFAGTAAHNAKTAISDKTHLDSWRFLQTAEFWFSTFAVWQAAFFAIGIYLILSIFTREENSPQAKAYEAPNHSTGEANN